MDYEYDVFVSYRREEPTNTWVRNSFAPMLEQWLPQYRPAHSRVFVDRQIQVGSTWSAQLQQALHRSRALVAVLSPQYFRSAWCCAEWQTFAERAHRLGPAMPVAFPIRFADGKHFPPAVASIQMADFTQVAFASPALQGHLLGLELEMRVRELAEQIANVLDRDDFPAWDAHWPVVTPQQAQSAPSTKIALPRI